MFSNLKGEEYGIILDGSIFFGFCNFSNDGFIFLHMYAIIKVNQLFESVAAASFGEQGEFSA